MTMTVDCEWSNRKETRIKRLPTINNRTWTRRIQWLSNEFGDIKLKFDEGDKFNEIGVHTEIAAQMAWDRFKEGETFESLKSIFGVGDIKVPASKKGEDAKRTENCPNEV